MPEETKDPMGILINKPGELARVPYLVTAQFQFRMDAQSPKRAEMLVLNAISISATVGSSLITQGISAHPLTEEMLAEFARQMEMEKGG